jgi:hypothetical protein
MSNIMPRVRGRAIEVPGGWSWEAVITVEPVEKIANLPSIDAELVCEPENLTIKWHEKYESKDLALASLKEHMESIKKILLDSLEKSGIKVSGYVNLKTGNFEGLRA